MDMQTASIPRMRRVWVTSCIAHLGPVADARCGVRFTHEAQRTKMPYLCFHAAFFVTRDVLTSYLGSGVESLGEVYTTPMHMSRWCAHALRQMVGILANYDGAQEHEDSNQTNWICAYLNPLRWTEKCQSHETRLQKWFGRRVQPNRKVQRFRATRRPNLHFADIAGFCQRTAYRSTRHRDTL